jgi:hypothetical protein
MAAAMDDKTLIAALTATYKKQLDLYRALSALVQKTLSQVILTRGDIAGIMDNFTQKQQLLDAIVKERTGAEENVALWQARKAGVQKSDQTRQLDAVLQDTQVVIKEFLDGEEQLKKYLEHVVKKGSAVS